MQALWIEVNENLIKHALGTTKETSLIMDAKELAPHSALRTTKTVFTHLLGPVPLKLERSAQTAEFIF
jgi:hypothetical protein